MTAPSNEQIRDAVSKEYAGRVRGVLASIEEEVPLFEATGCCSAPVAEEAPSCCGGDAGTDAQVTRIAALYSQDEVADLPSTVTDVSFGCGNPTAIAALQPGQVVLDLGSGGGIDCFLAAKMVGPTGKVYGVDRTPEMIALARKNAAKVGATNVEFRLGEIEELPLESESIDVIISNCVINLAPDKDAVFREAFRVLKPGGRLQVSDMVWKRAAPPELKSDLEQWAGCISGALLESDYVAKIRAAGFADVTSDAREYELGKGLATTNVVATRPGTALSPGRCC
ncbi:MAG: methyltransferase domain-containing protein [Chloroflexi bacterium CFX7]|nr:methyltransferase domain-containing protein [Chloroflexi bacterium CFX7]MCK6564251.1 arsenite methyltransferase [Dehalococcoidia bacterium]RIL02850.1 MAG: arsenite S-adenosylmethyltransferase [bacterium]